MDLGSASQLIFGYKAPVGRPVFRHRPPAVAELHLDFVDCLVVKARLVLFNFPPLNLSSIFRIESEAPSAARNASA